MKPGKILLLLILGAAFALFLIFDGASYLSFEYLQQQKDSFRAAYLASPTSFLAAYFSIYVFATAISFPGAAILTLAGGALFGFWTGLLVVSFASTLGALSGQKLMQQDYSRQ